VRDAGIDPTHTAAEMSFVLPPISDAAQGRLIGRIDDLLRRPPAAVGVHTVGLAAGAADTAAALKGDAWRFAVLALVAVFVLLVAVHRRVERAFAQLLPAVLAGAVAVLCVAVTGIALSPITVAVVPLAVGLGALPGSPIATSAVAACMLSLLASRVAGLEQLGAVSALSIIAARIAAASLVPEAADSSDGEADALPSAEIRARAARIRARLSRLGQRREPVAAQRGRTA
jgi:predicted RND superfamily exporter protein